MGMLADLWAWRGKNTVRFSIWLLDKTIYKIYNIEVYGCVYYDEYDSAVYDMRILCICFSKS